MKKKYLVMAIILFVIIALSIVTYATSVNIANNEQSLKEQALNIVGRLNDNSTTARVMSTIESVENNGKVSKVRTNEYDVELMQESKELVGIYSNNFNYEGQSTCDRETAKNCINTLYANLGLPAEYDLVYLEKLDEKLWEADYQKEYNGVYNMYEAVKIFFSPEDNEIAALTVFNEPYQENNTQEISLEQAVNVLEQQKLISSQDEIQKVEQTFKKTNDFVDSQSEDKTVKKAWVITKEDEKIYVDAQNANILGEDKVK